MDNYFVNQNYKIISKINRRSSKLRSLRLVRLLDVLHMTVICNMEDAWWKTFGQVPWEWLKYNRVKKQRRADILRYRGRTFFNECFNKNVSIAKKEAAEDVMGALTCSGHTNLNRYMLNKFENTSKHESRVVDRICIANREVINPRTPRGWIPPPGVFSPVTFLMIPIAKIASSYLLLGMGDTFWHMWHHLDAVTWHMSWRHMYMTVVKIHCFYHCLLIEISFDADVIKQ